LLEEVDLERLDSLDLGPAFRRLGTYRGILREFGGAAFNLAVWPVGVAQDLASLGVSKVPWPTKARSNGGPPPTPPDREAAEVPIVLVHGYFHNRSGFMVMRRALRRHGFRNVTAFTYNPLRKGIPELSRAVGDRVESVIDLTGSPKVHIVGHSLGGLLARYYVEQMHGEDNVHTVVTLGTPHRGTSAAYFGRSATARQMRPGADLIRLMQNAQRPESVRYLSYYSTLDALVVPTHSALLECRDHPMTRNVRVRDLGHLSLLLSQELIESIASSLSAI
jgi:triacylglycerol lipase